MPALLKGGGGGRGEEEEEKGEDVGGAHVMPSTIEPHRCFQILLSLFSLLQFPLQPTEHPLVLLLLCHPLQKKNGQ